MTPGISVLTLQPAVLRREFLHGNIMSYPESHHLDLVVDGLSLRDKTRAPADVVTPLSPAWLPTVPDALKELSSLGLAPGRA